MQLTLKNNLLFTQVTVAYQNRSVEIANVLVDTGSATTILATDVVAAIEIEVAPDDVLHTIRGVGGTEAVFTRWVDYLRVNDCCLHNFEIEIGGMDYGFELNGILGMNFLLPAKATINLQEMRIEFKQTLK